MSDQLPFTPSDAQALIPDPTSSLCGNFIAALLQLPVKFYQLVVSLVDDDGNFKQLLKAGDKVESFAPLAESDHRKLCNGQELSKTDFAALYAAIGDAFATMDGQAAPAGTNFRVPKCGARFALAVGTLPSATAVSLGGVGGEEKHVLTAAEGALIGADHDHTVGRMGDNTDDDGYFLTGTSDKEGNARGVTGDSNVNQTANINAKSGQYLVTSGVNDLPVDGSDDPLPADGHLTMPPYYGIFVYIITGK